MTPSRLPPGRQLDRLVAAHCTIAAAAPTGDDIGFMPSCFIRATMPHSRMETSTFERRDGNRLVTFMAPPSVGLPFGRFARLILIYLTIAVLRSRCRDIELSSSLSMFVRALLTTPTGGVNGSIPMVKEQLVRLLAMTTTLTLFDSREARLTNAPVADQFEIPWEALQADWRGGRPAIVRVGERMFNEMLTSAVPIDLRAVRALQGSLALDLYFWATYRSPRVAPTHPAYIAWPDLTGQFGTGYKRESDFKVAFRQALTQVQAVYPTLRCVQTETHFQLFRSPPSVPRR